MKTIFIVGLLALALAAFAVDPCSAQVTCNNQVGLYSYSDGAGPSRATMFLQEPLKLFLVLCRPAVDESGYDPLESINGFELSLRFVPTPDNDLLLIERNFHPTAVVLTGRDDINGGVIDLLCGYANDIPVTDGSVVLVELTFLSMGATTTDIYLEPQLVSSIPGEMVFCAGCPNERIAMQPVSGAHALPVFQLQESVVVSESMTFGTVKALYR